MSSDQLETSGRGFTFMKDEPLLMTMDRDRTSGLTAEKIVNTFTIDQIKTIIAGYGEERYAYRIAKAIVAYREEQPITTTEVLKDIITEAVPVIYRKGKVHPATKTFQALRIAVNDEIERLETVLEKAFIRLKPDGRLVVISFNSIEDRIVKRFMRSKADAGLATRITKKPIVPRDEEIISNPRSRSAKLRILEKK
jgi:16S rRNA (cytosine1402-N4)-methyltransferase